MGRAIADIINAQRDDEIILGTQEAMRMRPERIKEAAMRLETYFQKKCGCEGVRVRLEMEEECPKRLLLEE